MNLNVNYRALPKLTLWLVPLRFVLLIAESFIVLTYKGLSTSAFTLLTIPFAITVITNVLISTRVKKEEPNPHELALIFCLDIGLLWLVLSGSGGASNPFSIFFFLYLVIGSIIFSRVYAWMIGILTMLAFGALLTFSDIPHSMHHSSGFDDHLFGMWIAYVAIGIITLTSITYLSREITWLLSLNEKHKQDKLRLQSLTSLATGAAHELGSPLNTINLIIDSLSSSEAINDTQLILLKEELTRCKKILANLQNQSGENRGETPSKYSLNEVIESLKDSLPKGSKLIKTELPMGDTKFLTLPNTLSQALTNLVRNGIEASNQEVNIKAYPENENIIFEIEDRGPGMSEEIKSRIGEPFISTKPSGEGMGLGIFISKLSAEALQGDLKFSDRVDGGTVARLQISKEVNI
jgi:two-component system sensor histidine kinase RegB